MWHTTVVLYLYTWDFARIFKRQTVEAAFLNGLILIVKKVFCSGILSCVDLQWWYYVWRVLNASFRFHRVFSSVVPKYFRLELLNAYIDCFPPVVAEFQIQNKHWRILCRLTMTEKESFSDDKECVRALPRGRGKLCVCKFARLRPDSNDSINNSCSVW